MLWVFIQDWCADSIESCGYTDIFIPGSSLNDTFSWVVYAITIAFSNIAIIYNHHRCSHFAGILTLYRDFGKGLKYEDQYYFPMTVAIPQWQSICPICEVLHSIHNTTITQ